MAEETDLISGEIPLVRHEAVPAVEEDGDLMILHRRRVVIHPNNRQVSRRCAYWKKNIEMSNSKVLSGDDLIMDSQADLFLYSYCWVQGSARNENARAIVPTGTCADNIQDVTT